MTELEKYQYLGGDFTIIYTNIDLTTLPMEEWEKNILEFPCDFDEFSEFCARNFSVSHVKNSEGLKIISRRTLFLKSETMDDENFIAFSKSMDSIFFHGNATVFVELASKTMEKFMLKSIFISFGYDSRFCFFKDADSWSDVLDAFYFR